MAEQLLKALVGTRNFLAKNAREARLEVAHELDDEGAAVAGPFPTPDMNDLVSNAGASVGANRWGYEREGLVGSIVSIADGIHAPRFESVGSGLTPNGGTTTRGDGYKLIEYRNNSGPNKAVSFDGAGRMTSPGAGVEYTYDALGALALVTGPSQATEAYVYDFRGRLAGRLTEDTGGFMRAAQMRLAAAMAPVAMRAPPPTRAELLTYDGLEVVEAYDENEALKWSASWGPGIDNLLSLTDLDGHEYFAVGDGKANIVGWASTRTEALEAYVDYTPEGRGTYHDSYNGTECEETGGTKCEKYNGFPFGFHSAYSSSVTGLVYFRNRWYSPEAAQWLSQDPLGDVDSFDLYAFNAFDSVNFFDPMGLSASTGGAAVQGDEWVPGETPEQYCARTKSACGETIVVVAETPISTRVDMQQLRADGYIGVGWAYTPSVPSAARGVASSSGGVVASTAGTSGASSASRAGGRAVLTGARKFQFPWNQWADRIQAPEHADLRSRLFWRTGGVVNLDAGAEVLRTGEGLLQAVHAVSSMPTSPMDAVQRFNDVSSGIMQDNLRVASVLPFAEFLAEVPAVNAIINKLKPAPAAPKYVPRGRDGNPLPLPRGTNGQLAPSADHAHSQIGWKAGRKGDYIQTREFGENGTAVKQVDWTDHGRPKQHTNPHVHDFVPTGGSPQLGPARPPRPGEF